MLCRVPDAGHMNINNKLARLERLLVQIDPNKQMHMVPHGIMEKQECLHRSLRDGTGTRQCHHREHGRRMLYCLALKHVLKLESMNTLA